MTAAMLPSILLDWHLFDIYHHIMRLVCIITRSSFPTDSVSGSEVNSAFLRMEVDGKGYEHQMKVKLGT